MLRRRLSALTVVAAVTALAAAAPAFAVGTPDQGNGSGALVHFFLNSPQHAQTFTAGITGQLDRVNLVMRRKAATGGFIRFRIQGTLFNGVPDATRILAETNVPAAAIPPGSGGTVPIDFAPPAGVVAGQRYAITWSQSADTTGFPYEFNG